jgi:histone deacetylase 11
MLHQTGGTILAAKAALKRGWAINLGGGFHHASKNSGSGFCVFADITMAIKTLFKTEKEVKNILYIDLDVHQGNGPETDFFHDKRVFIFDVYNKFIFPLDESVKQRIDRQIEWGLHVEDEEYLTKLKEGLKEILNTHKFDLVIYNAGTDILEGDPLGNWNITEGGVIKRDEIVFDNAFKFGIPVVMLLSGGYQKKSARVISKSIKNLFEKFADRLSP